MTEKPRDKKRGGARLDTSRSTKPAAARKKKDKLIMAIMIVLALIMALAAVVAILLMRWVKKPALHAEDGNPTSVVSNAPAPPDASAPVQPDSSEPPVDETLDFDPIEPKVGGKRKSDDFYTILIYGADVTSGLTDTIMLVSYDVTNQKATIMSIPRDTQVNVRTAWSKSINAVYYANGKGEKGNKALMGEVSELVGFTPDYSIMINWELVGKMVDAIGGVDYDIPWEMWYEDDTQNLHIEFKPGMQHLNGKQAMDLVRWRKNNKPGLKTQGGGGDIGRLDLQHDFLKSVLKQTLQLKNVTKIGQLAQLFGENVVSDLTIENLFWFASQAVLGGLSSDDVNFVTMPYYSSGGKGIYANKVFPSQKSLLALINESLCPFVETVTIKQLDLMRVSADGNTMTSSTGKLADPSVAIPPSPEPSESGDPSASPKPSDSDDPSPSESPAASNSPSPSKDPDESAKPSSSPDPSSDPSPSPSESHEPQTPPEPENTPKPTPSPTPDPEPTSTIPDWLQPDPGA